MASALNVVELIQTKRDGGVLTTPEIDWLIDAYTKRQIGDEQMSALAMAIYFQGLNDDELLAWTQAMIDSGERMDFTCLKRPSVDKHSTGGVGDKITLPLVPLVAACGAAVPQLSGRGLGHTGGTLDKMEAIAGWRADLSSAEMLRMLDDIGGVICAAGPSLAPADKLLYALRDVTGTVPAIPLIASSIMSKKIAEGTNALVLDVKVGSGAFMKTLDQAQELAGRMVALGRGAGVNTVAMLTAMDTPLGRACGNGLEVSEAVEVLAGGGPSDVVELTIRLAEEMLTLVGIDADPAAVLASGRAMDVWRAMVAAQDGDPDAPIPTAKHTETITADRDGYITKIDAMAVGLAAWRIGAGRTRKDDPVQAAAGVLLHAKPGDAIKTGEPLLTLHTDTPERFETAKNALNGGIEIAAAAPELPPLILGRVG